jgi:hypothetical protein
MSLYYKYNELLTILRGDYRKFFISHNSKPLQKELINLLFVEGLDDSLTFYLLKSNKVLYAENIKKKYIYLPLFSIFENRTLSYIQLQTKLKQYSVEWFTPIFINTNNFNNLEDCKITLFGYITNKIGLDKKFSFFQVDITSIPTKSIIEYGTHFKIKFFKDKNFLFKTTNIILGHMITKIYNYIDNRKEIEINDGIVVIETGNPNEIENKFIRLIPIRNTKEWFELGQEFPILDIQDKKDIREFKVLGKVPHEKKIGAYKMDFSTGMFVYTPTQDNKK